MCQRSMLRVRFALSKDAVSEVPPLGRVVLG